MEQFQHQPEAFAFIGFAIHFVATPNAGPEADQILGEAENVVWERQSQWMDSVKQEIMKVLQQTQFGTVVDPHLMVYQGSIFGTIALLVGGGLTVLEALSKYPDAYDGLTLLREQLGSRLNRTTRDTLREGMPERASRVDIRVQVMDPYVRRQDDTSTGESGDRRQERDTSKSWGILAFIVIFAVGLIVGAGIIQEQADQHITSVLRPVHIYDFESQLPQNPIPSGNAHQVALAESGFNSKKSLQVSLAPSPDTDSSRHTGFTFELPDAPQVQVITAHIYLPREEQTPSEPIYARWIIHAVRGGSLQSPLTRLEPGHWMPVFWGTPFDSWVKPEIVRIDLSIVPQTTPYKGPMYVDDVAIYELAQ